MRLAPPAKFSSLALMPADAQPSKNMGHFSLRAAADDLLSPCPLPSVTEERGMVFWGGVTQGRNAAPQAPRVPTLGNILKPLAGFSHGAHCVRGDGDLVAWSAVAVAGAVLAGGRLSYSEVRGDLEPLRSERFPVLLLESLQLRRQPGHACGG